MLYIQRNKRQDISEDVANQCGLGDSAFFCRYKHVVHSKKQKARHFRGCCKSVRPWGFCVFFHRGWDPLRLWPAFEPLSLLPSSVGSCSFPSFSSWPPSRLALLL